MKLKILSIFRKRKKPAFKVRKRLGAGIMIASLLLTGGSFNNIQAASTTTEYSGTVYVYSYDYKNTNTNGINANVKPTSNLQSAINTVGYSAFDFSSDDGKYYCKLTDLSHSNATASHPAYYRYKFEYYNKGSVIDSAFGGRVQNTVFANKMIMNLENNTTTFNMFEATGYKEAASLTVDKSGNKCNFDPINSGGIQYVYYTWEPISYTIKFSAAANDVTGVPTRAISAKYDTTVALPSTIPQRTGYTFMGWSTNPTATTATYSAGDTVTNLTATNNATVTLYAVWKENTYSYTATIKDMCGSLKLGTNTISGTRSFTQAVNIDGKQSGMKNGSYPGYKLSKYGNDSLRARTTDTTLTVTNEWEVCDHKDTLEYTKSSNGTQHGAKCTLCSWTNTENCNFVETSHKNATCTEDSTEEWECSHCGQTKTTHNTKAYGHSFTLADVKKDALYEAATCTTSAKYYYSCANCGEIEVNPDHVFSNGDPLGHSYETVYEDNNGITNGKEYAKCTRCSNEKDEKYLLYIDPLDALKNDVSFTSGFGYYSKGEQVQVQGLASVSNTIGYGTPYYVYNDEKLDISTGVITMPGNAVKVQLTADLLTYYVNFNIAHAMQLPTLTYHYGSGIELPEPVMKAGYEFLGWYDNPDYTGSPITMITDADHADKTLYGKTATITYQIDYELGDAGDTGIEGIIVDNRFATFTTDSEFALPVGSQITPLGEVAADSYTFDGWFSDNSCASGSAITVLQKCSTVNRTYYAKFSAKRTVPQETETPESSSTPSPTPTIPTNTPDYSKITVSSLFELNGGALKNYTVSVKDGMIELPTFAQISKKDCVFNGWYTDSDLLNGPINKISADAVLNGSKVYAKWILNKKDVVPTTSPTATPEPTKTASDKSNTSSTYSSVKASATPKPNRVAKNVTTKTVGGIRYVMTSGKTCKVVKATNKKLKKAVIQEKVKFVVNGKTVSAKVTSINKNAFKGCKKLKKLTIKSKYIKTIGKQAFKGVSKKCSIKAPKKKYKIYKSCLKKAGFKGKVKK